MTAPGRERTTKPLPIRVDLVDHRNGDFTIKFRDDSFDVEVRGEAALEIAKIVAALEEDA